VLCATWHLRKQVECVPSGYETWDEYWASDAGKRDAARRVLDDAENEADAAYDAAFNAVLERGGDDEEAAAGGRSVHPSVT